MDFNPTESYLETLARHGQAIIDKILTYEGAISFMDPVDEILDDAPGYYSIIANPMCISTVKKKLEEKAYRKPEEFIKDMRLIWQNAMTYNPHTHIIHKNAAKLAGHFEKLAAQLPQIIEPDSHDLPIQRYVELRFKRYNANSPPIGSISTDGHLE